ncbi:hypothetical protein PSP31120_00249 [Pandoraea sputorum]|nr:hypothetical protein PSP31120_00249 [Pandoraea sputorum]
MGNGDVSLETLPDNSVLRLSRGVPSFGARQARHFDQKSIVALARNVRVEPGSTNPLYVVVQ